MKLILWESKGKVDEVVTETLFNLFGEILPDGGEALHH